MSSSTPTITQQDFDLFQIAIRNNIKRHSNTPEFLVPSLQQQYQDLLDILNRVANGELSESIILVGGWGCGKTMVLETAINSVQRRLRSQNKSIHVVHIDGNLQNDDPAAIQEIAQNIVPEEMETKRPLSILSNLSFLRECMLQEKANDSCLCIILHNIEEFASKHQKQLLLYYLLSLTQSSEYSITVIGETSNSRVRELFEKRVQSRFSNRTIFFPYPTFSDVVYLIKTDFTVEFDNPITQSFWILFFHKMEIDVLQSQTFKELIEHCCYLRRDFRWFQQLEYLVIASITYDNPFCSIVNWEQAIKEMLAEFSVQFIADISTVELCILIAMHKLETKGKVPYNFEMIFNEFKQSQRIHQRQYSKQILFRAFLHLCEIDIIHQNFGAEIDNKYYQEFHEDLNSYDARTVPIGLSIDPEEVLSVVESDSVLCPTALVHWAKHIN